MKTRFVTIDEKEPQADRIEAAAQIIRDGGLVAFPTETVYGLGGNALDPEASRRIYAAKGRPSDNPLIAHIADFAQLGPLVAEVPEAARILMKTYWPGPMTLIFQKSDLVPKSTTGGLDTVAVRMPSHPVARALIRAAGVPIAAPSANLSGRPSPTRASHVLEDMDGRIDMILDGGEVGIGLESTIIDVTGPEPALLRPGYISEEMIRELFAGMTVDAASIGPVSPDMHPKAPGMKYRHYAPKAQMTIVRGEAAAVQQKICALAGEELRAGKKVGLICTQESRPVYENRLKGIGPGEIGRADSCGAGGEEQALDLVTVGSRRDGASIAHNLYDVLRSFDTAGVDVIYSESFEGGQLGGAIMNRLKKAAGYHILDV